MYKRKKGGHNRNYYSKQHFTLGYYPMILANKQNICSKSVSMMYNIVILHADHIYYLMNNNMF